MKQTAFKTLVAVLLCSTIAGCEATYPKGKVAEAVTEICKKEFNADVKAELIGKTLAIYIPLPRLLSSNFGRITDESQDTIQNVLMAASRVSLSTDAEIEFYCVIAQDLIMPELQVIVIKYVDDVKRSYFLDISRSEYFKRTIFDMKINPQSQKEERIKEIFKKYNLDSEWEEQVLEEFFRSAPLEIKDYGYWNGRFYIEDLTLPEFLAEQIGYRIRYLFRENKKLSDDYNVNHVGCEYIQNDGSNDFDLKYDIKLDELLMVMGEKYDRRFVYENIINEVAGCIYGYKFKQFDSVRILNMNMNEELVFLKEDLYKYMKKKITIDDVMKSITPVGLLQ